MDDSETTKVAVVAFLAALISAYWAVRRLRLRRARRAIHDVLTGYFDGDVGLGELARRARAAAGRTFAGRPEFQSLVQTAFQRAAESKLNPHSLEVERKLLTALAAVKEEFGLPDRYQSEGWRPGRE